MTDKETKSYIIWLSNKLKVKHGCVELCFELRELEELESNMQALRDLYQEEIG